MMVMTAKEGARPLSTRRLPPLWLLSFVAVVALCTSIQPHRAVAPVEGARLLSSAEAREAQHPRRDRRDASTDQRQQQGLAEGSGNLPLNTWSAYRAAPNVTMRFQATVHNTAWAACKRRQLSQETLDLIHSDGDASQTPAAADPCLRASSGAPRWVQVAAHAQSLLVQLTVSVDYPLSSSGMCTAQAGANCTSTLSTNGALVFPLGWWKRMYTSDPQCYESSDVYHPIAAATVYIAATLVVPNTAQQSRVPTASTLALFVTDGVESNPFPGGCATIGNNPYDPAVTIQRYDDDGTFVAYQQADWGAPPPEAFQKPTRNLYCTCDAIMDKAASPLGPKPSLQYEIYRMFVSNCGSDFYHETGEAELIQGLKHMSTVEGVQRFGAKVDQPEPILPDASKLVGVNSIPGQGVVYNVIAYDVLRSGGDPDPAYASVYSPAHTYACSLLGEKGKPDCSNLQNYFYLSTCLLLGVAGIFLGLLGHRYFFASVFVMVFFVSSTGMYMILQLHADAVSDLSTHMLASIGVGVASACVFMVFYKLLDCSGVVIVFYGTCAGALLACFVLATPLGELGAFVNAFNYGTAFACVCLFFPVIMLVKPVPISIATSSIVGAYCVLYSIDYFVGSDFNDLYLNVLKRATDPYFAESYTGNYFGDDFNGCSNFDQNLGFLCAWVCISAMFIAIQILVTAPNYAVPAGRRIHCAFWRVTGAPGSDGRLQAYLRRAQGSNKGGRGGLMSAFTGNGRSAKGTQYRPLRQMPSSTTHSSRQSTDSFFSPETSSDDDEDSEAGALHPLAGPFTANTYRNKRRMQAHQQRHVDRGHPQMSARTAAVGRRAVGSHPYKVHPQQQHPQQQQLRERDSRGGIPRDLHHPHHSRGSNQFVPMRPSHHQQQLLTGPSVGTRGGAQSGRRTGTPNAQGLGRAEPDSITNDASNSSERSDFSVSTRQQAPRNPFDSRPQGIAHERGGERDGGTMRAPQQPKQTRAQAAVSSSLFSDDDDDDDDNLL